TGRVREEDVRRAYKLAKYQFLRSVLSLLVRGFVLRSSYARNETIEARTSSLYADNLGAWSKLEDAGLQELLSDLGELFRDSEDYNEDFLKPTESALTIAWKLLTEAGKHVDGRFPAGTVYPDGNGGLRIEWIRPSRELRLVVRPDAGDRHYIYHE